MKTYVKSVAIARIIRSASLRQKFKTTSSFGSRNMATNGNKVTPSNTNEPNGIGPHQDSLDGIDILGDEVTQTSNCLNMSFAGCGFLGIYHLGAARTFQTHGRGFLQKVDRFAGASAGALVASVLAVKGDDHDIMQECINFTYELARGVQGHKLGLLTPGLSLLDSLKDFLEKHLPDDAHVLASGRLYVSLTTAGSKKNIIVSEFDSKQDLIQCLLATSYVPHITGVKPVMRNGKKFIDGGMTDNLPILCDGRTVCVSPFSGRYEVCPVDTSGKGLHVNILRQDFQVNFQNIVRGLHAFFPPKLSQLEDYYHKGVRDALHFLIKEGWYEDLENGQSKSTTKSSLGSPKPTSPNSRPPSTLQYESTL